MKTWKTLTKKTVLRFNKYLTIESHTLELPNGKVIKKWPWVRSPEFINVLASDLNENFIIFRQVKYGLDEVCIAPVGGYIKRGELPIEAAKRELLEETGYSASKWIDLGNFRVDPNIGISKGHLFLARLATKVATPESDDLEEQELIFSVEISWKRL